MVGKKQRFKPSVAFGNQQSAAENIQRKIDFARLLLDRCSKASPAQRDVFLKALPRSVRAFNEWCSTNLTQVDMPLLEFGSNARETLSGNENLFKQVVALVGVVKNFRKSASRVEGSLENMAGLKRRLNLSEQLRAICQTELIIERRLVIDLQNELKSTRAAHVAELRETLDALAKANEETSVLRKQNKNLIVESRTVFPLKAE